MLTYNVLILSDQTDMDEHNVLLRRNTSLSNNLWHHIKRFKITPRQLATKSGVNKEIIYNLLKPNNTNNHKTLTVYKLEIFFGLEEGELFKNNDKS